MLVDFQIKICVNSSLLKVVHFCIYCISKWSYCISKKTQLLVLVVEGAQTEPLRVPLQLEHRVCDQNDYNQTEEKILP